MNEKEISPEQQAMVDETRKKLLKDQARTVDELTAGGLTSPMPTLPPGRVGQVAGNAQ